VDSQVSPLRGRRAVYHDILLFRRRVVVTAAVSSAIPPSIHGRLCGAEAAFSDGEKLMSWLGVISQVSRVEQTQP
jgi:hypothetical protein